MSLIEEIEESVRLGDAFGNNANLSEVLSDAKVLQKKVRESEQEILSLFQDAKSMKKANLISGDEISDILEMLCDINSDVSGKNVYSADKIEIALKSTKRERDNLCQEWNRYIRKEIGTQRGIVETLHILVEDTQRYMTLANLYNEIVANMYPGDKEILDKMSTYKKLADKLVKELDLKPSVMKFFEKMTTKNVLSLKEITPEIWKWIMENDFEDKFTIKIAEKQ